MRIEVLVSPVLVLEAKFSLVYLGYMPHWTPCDGSHSMMSKSLASVTVP